jgi:hypothetical protein
MLLQDQAPSLAAVTGSGPAVASTAAVQATSLTIFTTHAAKFLLHNRNQAGLPNKKKTFCTILCMILSVHISVESVSYRHLSTLTTSKKPINFGLVPSFNILLFWFR